MMEKKTPTAQAKQQKIFAICLNLFALEAAKGHLKWNVTELARKSNINRVLIYRHFGTSKKEILAHALYVFTSEFYGFKDDKAPVNLPTRIKNARESISQYHEAILFYQKWRRSESSIKNDFIKVEEKFQKQLQKLFPKFSPDQILMAHVCIHGLVTAPFLTTDQTEKVCQALTQIGVFGQPA